MASRAGGFDEALREGSEDRPDGWDGHGDEDDPFFDFAPAEEDADTVCFSVRYDPLKMNEWEGEERTGRVLAQDELSSPRPNDGSHAREDATSHEETQAPFQLAIDPQRQ